MLSLHGVKEIKDENHGVFRRLMTYFSDYRMSLIISLVCAVFVGLTNAALAPLIQILLDLFSGIGNAVKSGNVIDISLVRTILGFNIYNFHISSAEQAERLIWGITITALLIVAAKASVHFIKEFLLWRVSHKVLMALKNELFSHTVFLPQTTFDQGKSGEMLSRVTYDVTQVESAIRSGTNLLKSMIYAVIYVAGLFIMEWQLTLVALVVFPVSALIIKFFGDRVRRISQSISSNVADYTSYLGEAISGIKVIKAFGRESVQIANFFHKTKQNYSFNIKIARLNSIHAPTQEVISTIGTSVVILFCGYKMLDGTMTVGDLGAFFVLLTNAYKPIRSIGEANAVLQKALASSRQIFDLLDRPTEIDEIGGGDLKPKKINGQITFDDISFKYDGRSIVLNKINLNIKAGETIALVGPSGGGKSTIVNLIPRFYHPHSGNLTIDGTSVWDWDIDHLRQQIAIVPQETVLFSGSILDNIGFSRLSSRASEIVAAAESANAHDFISELPDGYDSEVGEKGVQLSGGQRQRIAIARAILRDPRILLLDEATSALDSKSEMLIQEALNRFRKNRTTIIIAHRISTVKEVDRIAVVVDGRIVEFGTHNELYQQGGVYSGLHDRQFAV